jgi:DNA-binding NtrC family response regulator
MERRVLIADDDPDMRALMEATLRDVGFESRRARPPALRARGRAAPDASGRVVKLTV